MESSHDASSYKYLGGSASRVFFVGMNLHATGLFRKPIRSPFWLLDAAETPDSGVVNDWTARRWSRFRMMVPAALPLSAHSLHFPITHRFTSRRMSGWGRCVVG